MEQIAICFDDLGKTYGRGQKAVQALRHLSLDIPAGQVYGFLGPNGAGKSTTIRLLMTLIRPTTGSIHIYGKDVRKHHTVLKRVGALVEGAAFYGYMTGRDNLEVLSRTAGDYAPQRISALLAQVDLSERADHRVSTYSMGMRQRLGVAAALLSDPDLVVLDEPTNGLDPAGIQDMREFIRSLAHEQGRTVFLSSHLLTEVEQVCDRVAIIAQGEMIREGTISELLSEGQAVIQVEATPLDQAVSVLQTQWTLEHDGRWLLIHTQPAMSPRIVRQLVSQDIEVHQVVVKRKSLEEYFISVTSNPSTSQEMAVAYD
jgi:ABC-2 type transport system ATP-binding protein